MELCTDIQQGLAEIIVKLQMGVLGANELKLHDDFPRVFGKVVDIPSYVKHANLPFLLQAFII